MAKHFGILYQGSKDRIALDIHKQLPSGKRFVDLFGGGFAMSHAALLIKGKYEKVYYNELNPLLCDLIKKACSGYYNYDNGFKPEWISREDFARLKDKDGYVRYIWSFGNNGKDYMFGENFEPIKKQGHEYVIFGKQIEGLNLSVKGNERSRRMALRKYTQERIDKIKRTGNDKQQLHWLEKLQQMEQLERLERLQQLEQLEQLERLQSLEINCGDYHNYKYQSGDIVYLDPPYENTVSYDQDDFDHKDFYDWCASRKYQVWFSSYKISDNRFRLVWAKKLRGLFAGAKDVYNFECLYTNK